MHHCRDVVVPIVSDRTFVADLARDCLRSDQRITGDYAGLPLGAAVVADQRGFIDFVAAILTVAH